MESQSETRKRCTTWWKGRRPPSTSVVLAVGTAQESQDRRIDTVHGSPQIGRVNSERFSHFTQDQPGTLLMLPTWFLLI